VGTNPVWSGSLAASLAERAISAPFIRDPASIPGLLIPIYNKNKARIIRESTARPVT
jgi:hypothetical protein